MGFDDSRAVYFLCIQGNIKIGVYKSTKMMKIAGPMHNYVEPTSGGPALSR